jgi:hypothetical protein
MPQVVQAVAAVVNNVNVQAEREIENIHLLTSSNVYWEVWTRYVNSEGKMVILKREFYNKPFPDLFVKYMDRALAELEACLWEESAGIDAMPTTTPEGIRDKSRFYGNQLSFSVTR